MIEKPNKILLELESKFRSNLEHSLCQNEDYLDRLFIKTRALSEIGFILKEKDGLRKDQIEIIKIFDEIFADIITSIYFAGSALDKPAQMVLRRALEMGIAIVFLWDLPHMLYAWKNHDNDLNFKDMLKHLTDKGYLSYISDHICLNETSRIINVEELQKIYRKLSNTIHGKISTFETNLNDRFEHNESDWSDHLSLVEKVLDEIISVLLKRFDVKSNLIEKIPAFGKLHGGKV